MYTTIIKNSAGKQTGITTFNDDNTITIDNAGKPLLILEKEIAEAIKSNNRTNEMLLYLYDTYYLSIGEIASLYNVCYSNINVQLKSIPNWVANKQGRRNRAYGHKVSKEQSEKMSKALKGRKAPTYERTPEIRQKISNSLKAYYQEHPQDPTPHQKNWVNGIYDNVDFKIGIAGYFTSLKNNKTFRFRSLLEMWYMLQLEQDASINSYQYEPFHIILDNGSSYLPDFLVNNILIELKPRKYVERVAGVKEKMQYKAEQAEQYCIKNNLTYKIIYDDEIDFDSKRVKHYIIDHPEVVEKYNITFIDKKRMVIK